MSLEARDRIGTNRLGVKSYTPAAGNRCCFIGNRAIHTLPVEVGDRIGHRKYGYKSSEGAVRTTCWNSIARMEFALNHTTATIHADYTTNGKYRYQYAHYGGEYGDDYATAEIYARPDKFYCLGYVDGSVASSNITSIPSECDLYLYINGDFVDFILHDEYGVTNYRRFGNIDAYLKKDGTKEKISLYIRPYDGVSVDTTVYVDIIEMDYENCLPETRQAAGYFAVNAWKIHDAVPQFTVLPVQETDLWTYPLKTDIYSIDFTAREGCIYALMDFWQYSNLTNRPLAPLYASYGYQWTYPWAQVGNQTGLTLNVLLNGVSVISRGYGYVNQAWTGSYDNTDRITADRGLIIGDNTITIQYPYFYSRHVTYGSNQWYEYYTMEYSAAYLVELQSERLLTPV
jgi:hypothetical protein